MDKQYINNIIDNINMILKLKNIDLYLKIFRYKPYILIQDYKISEYNNIDKRTRTSFYLLNRYIFVIGKINISISSCSSKYGDKLYLLFNNNKKYICESKSDFNYKIKIKISNINIKNMLYDLYLKN